MPRTPAGLPWIAALTLALVAPTAQAKKVIRKPRPPVADRPAELPPGPDADGRSNAGAPGPVVEATKTVWAQAGSRSWTGCSNVASEAANQLGNFGGRINSFGENHHWEIQARECPNAPEVLAMATRSELMRRFALPEQLDGDTDLAELELAVTDSRDQALAWIEDAETELRRRRDLRSLGLDYWRGHALLSTGDLDGAHAAFDRALKEGTVEGWKLRRLMALTVLYEGDLDGAIELATRAMVDAPNSDRLGSQYVLALVLDRAGDPSGARMHMEASLNRDGDLGEMRALEAALPIHERLYLRAFAKTVRRESSGALRLWDAYLARREPETPERRLAERHRAALQPLPTNLGGPARPGEAPGP